MTRLATEATLPAQLLAQSRQIGRHIAVRHKQLGIWQAQSWRAIADETGRLAGALAARGFKSGDTLVLLTHPRPQALLLSLAAQWLGGIAVPLDPAFSDAALTTILQSIGPRFLFLEDEIQVQRVAATGVITPVVIYAATRGLRQHSGLTSYTALIAPDIAIDIPPPQARTEQAAFAFYRELAAGQTQQQTLSHAELLGEGLRLVTAEGLSQQEEALAARAFAAGGQARYLLAPWLLAGFRLNFPENLATRDGDRRELGPTLVAGTRETWGRLAAQATERLPVNGTWQRSLIDAALKPATHLAARTLRATLGYWLVRRPLRDVLGLTRTRVPLLVGEPLPAATAAFFANLGLQVRTWPDPAQWSEPLTPPGKPRSVSGWQALDGNAVQPG